MLDGRWQVRKALGFARFFRSAGDRFNAGFEWLADRDGRLTALGTYLGSSYINDFNLFGRTLRVTAQAKPSARDDLAAISTRPATSKSSST